MEIVHLHDNPNDYPSMDYDVLITDYEIGDYCGSGEAVGIKDNQIDVYNLSHCSCYGPFDGGGSPSASYTVAEYTTSAMVAVGDRIYRESLKYILK